MAVCGSSIENFLSGMYDFLIFGDKSIAAVEHGFDILIVCTELILILYINDGNVEKTQPGNMRFGQQRVLGQYDNHVVVENSACQSHPGFQVFDRNGSQDNSSFS